MKSHTIGNRVLPDTLQGRAKFVLSYIMTLGRWRRGVVTYVFCTDAPTWVSDVFNVITHEGVADQRRQKFAYDALKRMAKGRYVGESIGKRADDRTLRLWKDSDKDRSNAGRRRYLDFARGSGGKEQDLRLARHAERAEVFFQVLAHLQTEPYGGERTFDFHSFQTRVAEEQNDPNRVTTPRKRDAEKPKASVA